MREVCDDVKENIWTVLRDWETRSRVEPWFSLPEAHRFNDLPAVVTGLVDASLCEPENADVHRIKVQAAAQHGYARWQQGFGEDLIFEEYHALREAIWSYISAKFGWTGRAVAAIMRIDSAISLATSASLRGYYQNALDPEKYRKALEELALSSPLLVRPPL